MLEGMESDQEVAILFQLNLNDNKGESVRVSWNDNDFTSEKQDSSAPEVEVHNKFIKNSDPNIALQNDLEFVRKHAPHIDLKCLNFLLLSHLENPNRLEVVMCDTLNIPHAMELIDNYRKRNNKLGMGEKRAAYELSNDTTENKKKKINTTENYLEQIQEMFPDADRLFLITECQELKDWEDFSRFINTVMISGVYPKKTIPENKVDNSFSPVVNIDISQEVKQNDLEESNWSVVSDTNWRQNGNISDESLIESLQQSEMGKELINQVNLPAIIDLADNDDNTQLYSPPVEIESPHKNEVDGNMTLNSARKQFSASLDDWEMSTDDCVNYPSHNHKYQEEAKTSNLDNSGSPLLLGTPQFIDMSIQNVHYSVEKSLSEIIEGNRRERQSSRKPNRLLFEDAQPCTSRENQQGNSRSFLDEFEMNFNNSDTSLELLADDNLMENPIDETDEAEKWLDEQVANLVRIFPNTDPSFLREQASNMNMNSEAVNIFVVAKLENNDMPTRAEYEKKLEMEELQNRYTKNFSIEEFLKILPDPWKHFCNGNRNCAKYKRHSLCYLKSTFNRHYVRDIVNVFDKNKCNLYLSYKALKRDETKVRRTRRSDFDCNSTRPTTINIQFLQEVAFIENEDKIQEYISTMKIARQLKFEEAKQNGRLLECQCCFDSEVMVEDIVYCGKDHSFCKDCIVKMVEVEMGNGKCVFVCPASCDEKLTLSCLQGVLKPELFSKVLQANQMEEIRAAGIEDLVQCPFCTYATIMPPEQKVMICLNPECLKESCRMCKELNHIPLRCDEVEKSEEVKMRTYIENKMTEALVRTCYKCQKKFVKEDGCNKMTCTCGAKMCYICRQPVVNYSHFNGQGGTEFHKCPLYSTNDELHVDLVARVGAEAKAEILQAHPERKLLYDPTAIMPKRANDTPVPGINNGAAINQAIGGILNEQERRNNEGIHNRNNRRPGRENLNNRNNHQRLHELESSEGEEEQQERRDPTCHMNQGRHHHRHHRHHHHH